MARGLLLKGLLEVEDQRVGDVFAFEKPSRRIPRNVLSQAEQGNTWIFHIFHLSLPPRQEIHPPLVTERWGPSPTALGDSGHSAGDGMGFIPQPRATPKKTQQQQASWLFYREKQPEMSSNPSQSSCQRLCPLHGLSRGCCTRTFGAARSECCSLARPLW